MLRYLYFVAIAASLGTACNTANDSRSDAISHGDDTSAGAQPGAGSSDVTQEPGQDETARNTNAGSEPQVKVTKETLEVAGQQRMFVLAAPSTYSPQTRYPLVLVLHGDGGDGASMRAGFPFDQVTKQAAFVAYPTGTLGWNLYDPADKDTDLAFLVALVESLEKRFTIDPARVFGTGFSSGAFMVNQVGCRRPSLFRGIVSHSGGAPNEPQDPTATHWTNDYTRCANQTLGKGPAVMVVHGTADPVVTYDSGEFTAEYWAYVNGCATTRGATAPAPCLRQEGCPSDRPVVFCPIANLEHAIWAQAANATWQFFQRL
jgi:polyhydroxybutyrate depolymerase